MMRKLAAGVIAASVVVVSPAAPAHGAMRYYQQLVTGSTQAECEGAGSQLAQQKRAEGYLVTWIGCGRANFRYEGLVGWSD